MERYKARLEAQGFTQTFVIDQDETFASVAKMNFIRVLLSPATNLDRELYQIDVKNDFRNAELDEEIYVKIPPGFRKREDGGKVCKLKQSFVP